MMSICRSLLKFAVVSSLAWGGMHVAMADEIKSPDPMGDKAFDVAMARISQDLSHQQIAVLQLIAEATAAAGLCEDLELDESAVHGALVAATHDATEGIAAEEHQMHRDMAMIAYGVLVGLALDRAARSEADFCGNAVKMLADPEENAFLKAASTAVPYVEETSQ